MIPYSCLDLRILQERRDRIQYFRIGFVGVIESWSVDKDDPSAIQLELLRLLDRIRTRLEGMTDG